MIKYTSKDIIERARQIADLEDSSFISWNENMSLLNEAYTSFYQKIIDKDEGFFVKNAELQIGKNTLPDDFFQIKYIGLISGESNTPILRRPKTDNFFNLSYDVQGNYIYINGTAYSGKIVFSYYTVPPTLSFPNEKYKVEIDSDILDNLLDANKNLYLFKNTEGEISIYNSRNGKIKTFSIPETATHLKVFSNGIVYFDEGFKCILFDGQTYTGEIYIRNNSIVISELDKDYYRIITESNVGLYYVINRNLYGIKKEDDLLYLDSYEFKSIFFCESGIYLVVDNGILSLDLNLNVNYFSEDTDGLSSKFINAIDLNSGYGILKADYLSGEYFMCSFLQDTELNFSNTFFFPIIAYDLARSYKIKQGADVSGIDFKYKEVLQQFYDSISMDSNNPIRIANVY